MLTRSLSYPTSVDRWMGVEPCQRLGAPHVENDCGKLLKHEVGGQHEIARRGSTKILKEDLHTALLRQA